jgi:hypothetical protein
MRAGERMCARHDDGLARGAVDERMRSCGIMFSHTSHSNTSTSGSPLRAGNDSSTCIVTPQRGQAGITLSVADSMNPSQNEAASPQYWRGATFIVAHTVCRNKIMLFRRRRARNGPP